jgi:hypothetical protein
VSDEKEIRPSLLKRRTLSTPSFRPRAATISRMASRSLTRISWPMVNRMVSAMLSEPRTASARAFSRWARMRKKERAATLTRAKKPAGMAMRVLSVRKGTYSSR